jgi:integrase
MLTDTQNLLTCLTKKGEKVQKIEAYILNRKDRKAWYIRYKVFFKNDIASKEESTKVLKTEKTLKYMQSKYLPAWILKKEQELKVKKRKSTKFEEFARKFLLDYEKNHDYQNVAYRTNRILGQFSDRDIKTITKGEVKEYINSLKNLNSVENLPLSKNSKLKYLRIFNGIFEIALDHNVIEKNFCNDIKFASERKKDANKIKPFSTEEVLHLLEKSKNVARYGEYLHNYLGLAFNQGLSPAEILGLQVGDINLNNRVISIKRNLTKGKVKETKTVYRDRVIPIFDTSVIYLESLILLAKEKKSIWLFSKQDGRHLNDIEDLRGERLIVKDGRIVKRDTKWYLLLKDCNIDYRDLKNTRHTFAVSAIESKAFTMQEIANILGHGSLQMLINHYAKWLKGKAIQADRNINLFGDTLGDTNKKDYLEEVYKLS